MSWQSTGLAALALAAAHIAGAYAKSSSARLRSFAGGVGVAYVFTVILPLLSTWQGAMHDQWDAERFIFLVALAGFSIFYVVEASAIALDERRRGHAAAWVEAGGLALYSFAVGFVLANYGERGMLWLIGYTTAVGLHFYMNAHSTAADRKVSVYARWMLASATPLGWLAGQVMAHHYHIANALFAGMAGAMMLNIMMTELPSRNKAIPSYFLSGVTVVAFFSSLS